jgi:hypothetical protein
MVISVTEVSYAVSFILQLFCNTVMRKAPDESALRSKEGLKRVKAGQIRRGHAEFGRRTVPLGEFRAGLNVTAWAWCPQSPVDMRWLNL